MKYSLTSLVLAPLTALPSPPPSKPRSVSRANAFRWASRMITSRQLLEIDHGHVIGRVLA